MFQTLYHFDLNNQISPGKGCIGSAEENTRCLCYVTVGGKINIFSPQEEIPDPNQEVPSSTINIPSNSNNNNNSSLVSAPTPKSSLSNQLSNTQNYRKASSNNNNTGNKANNDSKNPNLGEKYSIVSQTLNINKDITCIKFGKISSTSKIDLLFIGCMTSLMCYNIQENKTLFEKEIMEGVFCMDVGYFAKYPMLLCMAGGNCSVVGVDENGEDKFWTVLGGNAICIQLFDLDNDGANELIVGTDDFAIRIYKDENVLLEINENTKITQISALEENHLAYALENGTVGLYNKTVRLWKNKEKGAVTGLIADSFSQDEFYEIIAAWDTGKVQLFNLDTGRVMSEFNIGKSISSLIFNQFTQGEEKLQLIVLCECGECYGYKYLKLEENDDELGAIYTTKDKKVTPEELSKYKSLLKEKNDILNQLDELAVKESNKQKINSPKDEIVLPKNTKVNIDLQSNNDDKCADLIIESTPEDTVVHSVVIMSEQIYKGDTYVRFPSSETNKVIIQIKNKKDLNINLHIKVLVGKSYYLNDYQVFEFNKIIPKYCFYILLREDIHYKDELVQGVWFEFNERIDRLVLWLEYFFNIGKKELESFKKSDNEYIIRFMSLRTDKILQISAKNNVAYIYTEEIELAGNILQDMCNYFKIKDLNTNINYTEVVKGFGDLVKNIQMLDKERNQYNINMTEIINLIKDLFVKAEDNRLLDNINVFKDYFRKINVKNLELLDEFEKRTNTYKQLISDLKQINEIIQIFSNLKTGKYKNEMISLCRNCIRKKNYDLLFKIMSTGSE